MIEEIIKARSFQIAQKELSEIYFQDKCLPGNVFSNEYRNYLFCEFDRIFNPSLFLLAMPLFDVSRDKTAKYITLDPPPDEYYFKHFGKFGAFSFEQEDDPDRLWDVFENNPGNSPADALAYITNSFIMFPHSKTWLIWGSRSINVVILSSKIPIDQKLWSFKHISPVSLDFAQKNFFQRGTAFDASMRANYPPQTTT